jgi:hypothetical protein
MEHIPQVELEEQWKAIQRHDGTPEANAYLLARFIEARLLVQERSEVNRLRARIAKLEHVLAERMVE